MSGRPAEVTALHTRIMKCALEVEEASAYWRHAQTVVAPVAAPASTTAATTGTTTATTTARRAFDEHWFGARSLARVEDLLANFRVRFDAYPAAVRALAGWTEMDSDTRRLIAHWHLQLADPLYRSFTGQYLVERHAAVRPAFSRAVVVAWVGAHGLERWTMPTRVQFASKLLSAAFAAGLVTNNRDPRAPIYPRVTDLALGYLLHLLRGIDYAGTILANPYLASVGLAGRALDERLRALPALRFSRQGDLVEFEWRHLSLDAWAAAMVANPAVGDPAAGKPRGP